LWVEDIEVMCHPISKARVHKDGLIKNRLAMSMRESLATEKSVLTVLRRGTQCRKPGA
jgi:hypothetical protein